MTTELNNISSVSRNKLDRPQLPSVAQPQAPNQPVQSSAPAENIVRVDFTERQSVANSQKSDEGLNQNQQVTANKQNALVESVSELNQNVQAVNRSLEFRVDEASGRTVITVRDRKTDEVIRQIPSDQFLEISARLQELQDSRQEDRTASGILFTSQT